MSSRSFCYSFTSLLLLRRKLPGRSCLSFYSLSSIASQSLSSSVCRLLVSRPPRPQPASLRPSPLYCLRSSSSAVASPGLWLLPSRCPLAGLSTSSAQVPVSLGLGPGPCLPPHFVCATPRHCSGKGSGSRPGPPPLPLTLCSLVQAGVKMQITPPHFRLALHSVLLSRLMRLT